MKKIFASSFIALIVACSANQDNDELFNLPPTGKLIVDSGKPLDAGKLDEFLDGGASLDAEVEDSGETKNPDYIFNHYDINAILITGQSNSVSNSGTPVLSVAQPYNNLSFNTGVMSMKDCDGDGCRAFDEPSAFVPLIEGDHFFNYNVETAASGLANQISFLAQQKGMGEHNVLASLDGRSGNTYWCLRKGGCNYKAGYLIPFTQGIYEASYGKMLATQANKSYTVRAVFSIHGESDHYSYTAGVQEFPMAGSDGTPGKIKDYTDALMEWQEDYENDIRSVIGITHSVPLFISQLSGWTDGEYSKIAQMQLTAHSRSRGRVVLVTPAYPLELNQMDCLHYTSEGERHLGEYFAKAYAKVIFNGEKWEPVRPKNIWRNGRQLSVQFYVPVPPLQIDTTRVALADNYGFSFTNSDGKKIGIESVSLSGPDMVSIILAEIPGSNSHLLYAQNQGAGCIGKISGARGNLRDSDKTPSRNGYDLFNWAVNSDTTIP